MSDSARSKIPVEPEDGSMDTALAQLAKWVDLRFLFALRRIAKALERANQLEEHRQEIEYPRLRDPKDAPPKRIVISRGMVGRSTDEG